MSQSIDKRIPPYLQPGYEYDIGNYCFTSDEIIRFANKFDNQTFHTDPKAAEASPFGSLCASGWHTAAIWMKLQRAFVEKRNHQLLSENPDARTPEYGPSPGIKNLKLLLPVYADETINFTNRIDTIRQTKSKPGWWIMTTFQSGKKHNGDIAISFDSAVFIRF